MATIIKYTVLTLLAISAIASLAVGIYTVATHNTYTTPFFFSALALIIFKLIYDEPDE